MINLQKNARAVTWDSQVFAFKWYQNIGDALSHFAHFGSFLSETQREDALKIIGCYEHPTITSNELVILKENVEFAPIFDNKTSLTKIKL